jgi:excisionase family DNA binding protein
VIPQGGITEGTIMLTLNQAAERLGVTASTLRQQIHAGQLEARRLGPIWVVDEAEVARYHFENRVHVGRPFVGRPGYVDTRHIRQRLLLAPADGRGHDAIWLQYFRQSFVLDLDLTNAAPFRPTRETYEHLDMLAGTPPGGREIELWNRQHVALEIRARGYEIGLLLKVEPSFPRPVVEFHDGPVWDAGQVQRWLANHGPGEPAPSSALAPLG